MSTIHYGFWSITRIPGAFQLASAFGTLARPLRVEAEVVNGIGGLHMYPVNGPAGQEGLHVYGYEEVHADKGGA